MNTITQNDVANFHTLPLAERREHYIPEEITTAYPIQENSEALVALEELAQERGITLQFAPASQDNAITYLRTEAAQRLMDAATQLKRETSGQVQFVITDTFRPLALQKKYFAEISQEIQEKEGLEGKALWERVTQFIADPELCPPHSTGGAIDLCLAAPDGTRVDMGTPIDTIDDKAYTWSPDITEEARANRELLWRIMTDNGFVNLASEWWHFSFGDQYWAIFHGHAYAHYGSRETV